MIKKPNYVFVLDANKKPLTPCKPSMAKKLLIAKKAAVYRRFPFTIILKKRCAGMGRLQPTTDKCWQQNVKLEKSPLSTPARVSRAKERAPREECTLNQQKLELKIDPGSQTTGLSLVLNDALIWCAELNHRGSLIKKKLESRRASRINRNGEQVIISKWEKILGIKFECRFQDGNIAVGRSQPSLTI